MSLTFSVSGKDIMFWNGPYSTEASPEAAREKADKLNAALRIVAADALPSLEPKPDDAPLPGTDSQFIPFASPGTTDPDYSKPSSSQQHQPEQGKKKVDPDGDGDDDSSAATDTDHDFWTAGGKQKKPLPGKPLPKGKGK